MTSAATLVTFVFALGFPFTERRLNKLWLYYDRMKKAQAKGNSKAKAKNRAKTVDEYFANIEGPAHEMLSKIRSTIRSVVPAEATEVISYGIPAFKKKSVLVWYAAFANHCSLFPGGAVLNEMKNELDGFSTSKGTIQFPLEKPLPTALVKKIVQRRVAQLDQKS